jgi:hypothetical protein
VLPDKGGHAETGFEAPTGKLTAGLRLARGSLTRHTTPLRWKLTRSAPQPPDHVILHFLWIYISVRSGM